MKDIIEYYYRINNIKLEKNKDSYSFKFNNEYYKFVPSTREYKELIKINMLQQQFNHYDKLVMNINNEIETRVYNNFYILIKIVENQYSRRDMIINNSKYSINKYNFKELDRTSWKELWMRKIDYIEYQMNHVCTKYKILRNSINYYIGLGENAIQYLNNIVTTDYQTQPIDKIILSHKRIENDDFNNPLNVIIDYQSRDISEYLKYIFYKEKYNYEEIKKFLANFELSETSYKLIFARLLFPTYFFDLYDKILIGSKEEKSILEIIKKSKEYEIYLKKIYTILNEQKKIPEVSWL